MNKQKQSTPEKKAILILQGDGALGAFECGVWKALYPHLRNAGYKLAALAGSSIGAVNAALIARHYGDPDGGVGRLELFWRKELASRSVPIFPWPGEWPQQWNGLLSSLLFGHPAIFMPMYLHWNPLGEATRLLWPLYGTAAFTQTLHRWFGEYRGQSPLLAIQAINIEQGVPVIFDSANETITPQTLAASNAIPIMFSPVEIDGKHYWSGNMWTHSPLPALLNLVRSTDEASQPIEDYLVVTIHLHQSSSKKIPYNTLESSYRLLNILCSARADHDERASQIGNAYLDFVCAAHEAARGAPDSPLTKLVRKEYDKLAATRQSRLEFLHIRRDNFPDEYFAREWDFSPERINKLIERGYESAVSAIGAANHQVGQVAPAT